MSGVAPDGSLVPWLEPELVDPVDDSRGVRLARLLRHSAPLLAILLALGSGASLLVAGSVLASADLGTSLRTRSCDASALPALVALVLGGVLLALAPRMLRVRTPTSAIHLDLASAGAAVVVPAVLLGLSLPGTLGCSSARDIARWELLGDALTGIGGIALCATSAALVGVALAQAFGVHVHGHVEAAAGEYQPSLVELAMDEADELAREEELRRFRGVDS